MYLTLKRIFDLTFSFLVILLGLPLLVAIAVGIKISSPGPIFYKSLRIGKNFKHIYCWKFRTMYVDAEKRLIQLLETNSLLQEEWKKYQKLKNDPRIHPFGKILRKTSLDELPQFLNVLRGELSIVGPRPFCSMQVKSYLHDKAEKFLSVPPGITGIWQVSGRNLLTFEERLALEENYIDSRSFLLDLKIILKTIPAVLFAKGAY